MIISKLPKTEQPLSRLAMAGANAMSMRELLAIVIGGDNGLDIADNVLAQVDEVWQLCNMLPVEFMRIEGIGEAVANRIVAALAMGRRMVNVDNRNEAKITCPADSYNSFAHLVHEPQEQMWLLCLNTRNVVVSRHHIYTGTINAVSWKPADIIRPAVVSHAAAAIVAHNHPSGDCNPSPEDLISTRLMAQAFKQMDIDMLDHLIIGRAGRFCSLRERHSELFS